MDLQLLTPFELNQISNCSLQHHFWEQSAPIEKDIVEEIVLDTITHLHATGGPRRLNLPTTLRYLGQLIPKSAQHDVKLTAIAQQMVVNYHRRLRQEWPRLIASNELLRIKVKLKRSFIQCECVVERLDQEEDGGITVIKFISSTEPMHDFIAEDNIEATMLHALAAAAYPHKRPVRIKQYWLAHNQTQSIELTEKLYRANLDRMKSRVQSWLDGEIMARPGLYCEQCLFKYEGCPIYANEMAEDEDWEDEGD